MSRQFVEMNRLRVEGLLAAFPKLVGHSSSQHTYVETDSVRYIYQPLENQMYLLLITTKTSNIVEDLGTLRLLAKVVPDVAGGFQEHSINEHAFDLIFAFDEVISTGGYNDEATLNSIRNNLLMDSHEEKVQLALKQAKEEQAKAEMQQKAKVLQQQRMAAQRDMLLQGGTGMPSAMPGRMEGFGGGGMPMSNGDNGFLKPEQPATYDDNPYASLQKKATVTEGPKVLAKSGMKLGGGGAGGGLGAGFGGGTKKNSLMAAMAAEDVSFGGSKNPFDMKAPTKPTAPPSTPLTLLMEEKITASLNREGAVESCEVKGTLTLTANTDAGALALVSVNKNMLPKSFNFATHPKVDKKVYEKDGVLSLRGGNGFPVERAVGILRWSYNGEDAAPITVNCWPEDEGTGSIQVNIEMELTRTDLVLEDVNILIPLGTTDPPVINEIDGQYKHDARSGMMCWHFDQVDASNSTGSLEFVIGGSNTDAFFPVQIGFRSQTLLCPLDVTSVTNSSTGAAIPNQLTKSFVPETYQCA